MSSSQSQIFNPGPINPIVLYDQENHISSIIWDLKKKRKIDKVNNASSNTGIKKWVFSQRQVDSVIEAGFGFLLQPGNVVRTDVALLNALVERWRPETNTFHLPVGECTITLEDVVNILGIAGNGDPVAERPLKQKQFEVWFQTFKFEALEDGDLDSDGMKMTVLRDRFRVLPKDHTDEDEDLAVKAFLLVGIGSVLLPAYSNNKVHGRYIKFVSVLSEIKKYAWGPAVLAHTYRALCRVSKGEVKNFIRCATLLQVWAWLRISIGRPLARPNSELDWPRVNAYALDRSTKDKYDRGRQAISPHHTPIIFYRGELDRFGTHGVFEWLPYKKFFQQENNVVVVYARELGRCRVPLIHFSEIEYQLPDRVLRQFDMPLEIPVNPHPVLNFTRIRAKKKTDFERVDPLTVYSDEIAEWNESMVHSQRGLYQGNPDAQVSLSRYMQWYREITRLRIHPANLYEEPSDKYIPRSLIKESSAVELIEKATPLVKTIFDLIPESEVEVRQEARNWEEDYSAFTQSEIDPSFQYNLSRSDGNLSQKSNLTDFFDTPEHQNAPLKRKACMNETAPVPPAPMKDKGKRPNRGKWPEDGPSFSLGLGFTESQDADEDFIPGYDDDGDIHTPVPDTVKEWVNKNLWDLRVDKYTRYEMLGMPPLCVDTLRSLMPNEELWEMVVAAYTKLLIARQRNNPTLSRRKMWVADTSFLHSCDLDYSNYVTWCRQRAPKPPFPFSSNVLSMLKGGKGEQPAINDGCQYALIPFLHRGDPCNHFSLFLVELSKMSTLIVDSIHENLAEHILNFKKELRLVYIYLAAALRDALGMPVEPIMSERERPIHMAIGTPKQDNTVDCGVFVLKAMDTYLRGMLKFNNMWNDDQVLHFRYWISWELIHNRARG